MLFFQSKSAYSSQNHGRLLLYLLHLNKEKPCRPHGHFCTEYNRVLFHFNLHVCCFAVLQLRFSNIAINSKHDHATLLFTVFRNFQRARVMVYDFNNYKIYLIKVASQSFNWDTRSPVCVKFFTLHSQAQLAKYGTK